MRKKYNKFLIVSTIAIIIGGLYLHFTRDIESGELVPTAFGSSLVSTGGEPQGFSFGSDSIGADISFISSLVSLKTIKIDTSLFTNKSFQNLQNNAVKIEKLEAGRLNPFAPIDENGSASLSIITNPANTITDKSAVLNGSLNITSGVSNTYFEYGLSENGLNNIAIASRQSMVGTFIKNVSGLTPKTTYFFRACAKVGGSSTCGEVVSFTTN